MDSLAADSLERNGFDAEAQRAARDAIMEIPAFPELLTRLTRVFGPGAERDMIHQLIYWFSKPKMQHRWWAYKTADEWRDERGLNRKQVNKGRARLKPWGVLEEKYGNYKRLHYRIDWVRLAELLSIPLKGDQSDEWGPFEDDPFFDELSEPLKGGQSSWDDTPKGGSNVIDPPQSGDKPDTYAENHLKRGGQTNAREYAGEYIQENSPLQGAPEPALAEPGAPEINKDKELKEGLAPPSEDKRHSENGHTPSGTTAVRDVGEAVVTPPKPDDDTLLDDVREILDPDSGRWWGATFVAQRHMQYVPETVAMLVENFAEEEEIERPEVVRRVERSTLEDAVRYVMWEAEEEEAG